MSDVLERLRELRNRTRAIAETTAADLRPFLNRSDGLSYRYLPTSPLKPKSLSVGSTCTALMALLARNALSDVYGDQDAEDAVASLFKNLMRDPWDTARLSTDNPFTAVLVLRTAAELHERGLVDPSSLKRSRAGGGFASKPLAGILRSIASDVPESLAVQDSAPHPAVAYWFADAASRLPVALKKNQWEWLADWSTGELRKQISLASSHDQAADPVALAMAACLARRVEVLQPVDGTGSERLSGLLPTRSETSWAIDAFFDALPPAGLWPLGFEIFHYPESGGCYCWCIEALDAILREYPETTSDMNVVNAHGRVVDWCETNKLSLRHRGEEYCGWNSGSHKELLHMPECWATATVHVYLSHLDQALSHEIESRLLHSYAGDRSVRGRAARSRASFGRLLDCDLTVQGRRRSLKRLLDDDIIKPVLRSKSLASEQLDPSLKRSALLFGPPGTAKTSLVRAIAECLGWPVVEITPNSFLKGGTDSAPQEVARVFTDLLDLTDVVVMLDEVDTLVHRRSGGSASAAPNITQDFLTTSMLPHLATLHDRGRVLYFLMTNHRASFDDAILRPGRFDLLLCVGPPPWRVKKSNFLAFLPDQDPNSLKSAATLLGTRCESDEDILDLLDNSTFDEFRGLLEQLSGGTTLLSSLRKTKASTLRRRIRNWGKSHVALSLAGGPNPMRDEYERDKLLCRVQ